MFSRDWVLILGTSLLLGSIATAAELPAPATPFGHVTLSGDARGFWLLNQETGNIYRYDIIGGRTKQRFIGAVTQPGKPLSPVEAAYNPAAIPRSQLRALASTVLGELQLLVGAVDQWAIEWNKPRGAQPTIADLAPYIHRATRLRYWMDQGKCQDSLGNPIVIPAVDGMPVLSKATYDYFSGVVTEDFWIPFPVEE